MKAIVSLIDFIMIHEGAYTSIKYLNLEEKIYEIASLISTDKVSQKQIDAAKEMVLATNSELDWYANPNKHHPVWPAGAEFET